MLLFQTSPQVNYLQPLHLTIGFTASCQLAATWASCPYGQLAKVLHKTRSLYSLDKKYKGDIISNISQFLYVQPLHLSTGFTASCSLAATWESCPDENRRLVKPVNQFRTTRQSGRSVLATSTFFLNSGELSTCNKITCNKITCTCDQ